MILGIDEVGRGPWAGPLVVGAVVLGGVEIDGLTDSKKLTKKKREQLYEEIIGRSAAYSTGWVEAWELDELGMSQALRLATRRAVEQIGVSYSEIIIDGTVNFLAGTGKGRYVQTMKKADLLVPSVSAASILAKVERDKFMSEQDDIYPGYGFASHVGYGVARHRQAIEELGVTPLHRLSFAPLVKYRSDEKSPLSPENPYDQGADKQTTRAIGNRAESEVVNWLTRRGHTIIDRNWKTRWCEIDIVSFSDETVYFTEVKYRKNADYGDGLEAITKAKLKQMKFSSDYYVLKNKLTTNVQLAVASVSGIDFVVDKWLTID